LAAVLAFDFGALAFGALAFGALDAAWGIFGLVALAGALADVFEDGLAGRCAAEGRAADLDAALGAAAFPDFRGDLDRDAAADGAPRLARWTVIAPLPPGGWLAREAPTGFTDLPVIYGRTPENTRRSHWSHKIANH